MQFSNILMNTSTSIQLRNVPILFDEHDEMIERQIQRYLMGHVNDSDQIRTGFQLEENVWSTFYLQHLDPRSERLFSLRMYVSEHEESSTYKDTISPRFRYQLKGQELFTSKFERESSLLVFRNPQDNLNEFFAYQINSLCVVSVQLRLIQSGDA